MLGLSYQEKGSLELAYNTYNKLPLNGEVITLLYHLAIQLEKKRKNSLAVQTDLRKMGSSLRLTLAQN
jgi:hypothetical protein